MIITDSGGVQKEAYFFQKPCIILRPQTEWVEILDTGLAALADADKTKILEAYHKFENIKIEKFPAIFGQGNAAEFICSLSQVTCTGYSNRSLCRSHLRSTMASKLLRAMTFPIIQHKPKFKPYCIELINVLLIPIK